MISSIGRRITFSGQLWLASLFYLGVGSLLLAITPGPPSAVAGYPIEPCEDGEIDCHGTCIPEGHVCCEDGTHGDAGTCACCTGCVDSNCVGISTLICLEDVEQYLNNQNP